MTCHLIKELVLCGGLHTIWMYFIKRYMKTLKNLVRNRGKPEESMAKGYSSKFQSDFVHST